MPAISPHWQRPADWPRTLPREWMRPSALNGVDEKRMPGWKRAAYSALGFLAVAGGVFIIVIGYAG